MKTNTQIPADMKPLLDEAADKLEEHIRECVKTNRPDLLSQKPAEK